MQGPSSFLDSRLLSVFTVGVLGSLVFLVWCALCIVRCFDRCGDEQRRALRDDDDERLVGPWAIRMQQMRQLTLSPARGAGVAGSCRAAYARLPMTDRTSSSIFVGLPLRRCGSPAPPLSTAQELVYL